jgi:ElaB/YqjD/DUF883 family membrane-anchored ribosome-binding protein
VSDTRGATQRASDAIADAADRVSTAASQAGSQANDFLSEIEGLIRQNPLLSVGIAAAVGYAWARVRH